MIKIVLLFLVVAGLIGMTGRFRSGIKTSKYDKPKIQRARKCKSCGTYLVGNDDCPCGADNSPKP